MSDMLSGIEIPGSSADTSTEGTPPLSDSDKLHLIREEYKELKVQEKDTLHAAMAHSRKIFSIQDIAGNQTNQQEKVDEKTVNYKFRRLALEMHSDKHVKFCETHNIEDPAGILKTALKKAVQTMQDAKNLVLCWPAIYVGLVLCWLALAWMEFGGN